MALTRLILEKLGIGMEAAHLKIARFEPDLSLYVGLGYPAPLPCKNIGGNAIRSP
jgi:hypothetical protein